MKWHLGNEMGKNNCEANNHKNGSSKNIVTLEYLSQWIYWLQVPEFLHAKLYSITLDPFKI